MSRKGRGTRRPRHGRSGDVRSSATASSRLESRRDRGGRAARRFCTVATRGELERHGTPRSPQELAVHDCLVHVLPNGRAQDVRIYGNAERGCEAEVSGDLVAYFGRS
jgi:hypothetical protein